MWLQYIVFASLFVPSYFFCSKPCEHSQALGIEGGWIPDSSFQASSQLNIHHRPQLARLYNVRHGRDAGGWSAKTNDGQQWIKVDLGATKLVTEVLTQGRQDAKEWVKKFTVGYGEDGEHYKMYRDGLSFVKEFSANFDNNKTVKNKFNPPIRARFIRIFPCKWHGRISMRIEFKGSPGTQQKLKRCPRTVDMGFLIAGSRQVGRANFALQKSFVLLVSNMFEVSLHGSHVGLVTYSSRASVEMRFSSFLSNLAVQQRISRIPFPDEEGQRIDLGLDAARKLFNGPEYISRLLLVVVSGLKNRSRALKMIKEMHAMEKQRIKVHVVVIGTTFGAGLKKLLGYGNGKVFYLPSFKSLLTHQKDIAHQICQVNELDPIKIIRR